MRKPYGRGAVGVGIGLLVLSGCAGGEVADASDHGLGRVVSTPSQDRDLEEMLLDVGDIPTGGWRRVPDQASGSEVSTNRESLGVCFLDLSDVMSSVDLDADRAFTRDRTNSYFVQSVAQVDDPGSVLVDLEHALSGCEGLYEGAQSGERTSVRSEPAELPGLDPHATYCRSFQMTPGYTTFYGHLCVAAEDEFLLALLTLSRYSAVPEGEVVALFNAAVSKVAALR